MSYEENLKRMHTRFVEFRHVDHEMHQLYLDDQPIGSAVTAEKATGLFYWLATALPDLEKVLKARTASEPSLPPRLTGEEPERKSRKKTASRGAARSRKP